jgi:hypothetical protein
VHTAMPTAQAQRLCPQAAFLSVDMKAYRAAQGKLLELFGHFTDVGGAVMKPSARALASVRCGRLAPSCRRRCRVRQILRLYRSRTDVPGSDPLRFSPLRQGVLSFNPQLPLLPRRAPKGPIL